MKSKKLFLALFFGFLALEALIADTIYLKSGGVVIGKIVSQNREEIRIATESEVLNILKTDIQRVTFGDMQEEEQKRRAAR